MLPEPDLHIAVHLNGAAGGGSELVTLTRDGSTWIVLRAASPWTENPDKMAVRSAPGRWHVYARAWYIRATITDSMKFEDLGDLGVIDPTVHWELFDVAARSSGGVIHLAATAKDNTTIVRHPDLMVTSATDTVVGRWHATDVITSGGGGAVTELSDGSVVAAFSALGENAGSPLRLWLAHATADAKPIAERYPDVGDAGFVQDLVSIGDGDAILAWTEQQAGGSDNWMTTGRLTRIDAKLQVVWTQKLTSPYQGLPQRLRLAGSTLFLTGPAGWVSDTLLTRAFGLDGELLFAQTLVPAPNWDVGGDLYVPKSGPLQLVMIAKELQLWPLPSGL